VRGSLAKMARIVCRPAGIAAAVAVLGLGCAGGAMLTSAQSAPSGITVTGQGTASLPPDQAIVSGNVQSNAATADEALAQNAQAAQAVVAAARTLVDGQGTVQTTSINVFPQYAQPQPYNPGPSGTPVPTSGPPQIVGYQATTGIQVTTNGLDTLGALVQGLVNAGMNQLGGVQFTLQNPEPLRVQALQAAIDDATAQAQAAAARLGVTLGPVLNVQVGYSSAPPIAYATAAAGYIPQKVAGAPAPPPIIAPGPLTANTSVTITFGILPAGQ
jgi:uncharacterized protein